MYIYTTPIDIFGIDTGISEFQKNLIQVSEFEENSKVEVRQKYQWKIPFFASCKYFANLLQ